MGDIKISTITLEIGKKTIMLTVEQAKELRAVLGELLGADKITERVVDHYPYPWWGVYPTSPNIPWTNTSNATMSSQAYSVTLALNSVAAETP